MRKNHIARLACYVRNRSDYYPSVVVVRQNRVLAVLARLGEALRRSLANGCYVCHARTCISVIRILFP